MGLFVILSASILPACSLQTSSPTPAPSAWIAPAATSIPTAGPIPNPTRADTPTPPPCSERNGRGQDFQIGADGLAQPLQARVHLPPCYDPSGETRYPVLYLLHGQGFNTDQWERLGAPQALDRLTAAGEIQPILLVLPEEVDTAAYPFESAFAPALADTLIPAIDQTYPTCPERSCRAIGGLSRGASWAVLLALTYPERFAAAGAHSFPPFTGLEKRLPGLLAALSSEQSPLLYIDIGFSDPYRAPASHFETLLTQAGLPHEWYLNQGGHDEEYWSAHVEEYLRWYAAQLAP